MKRTEIIEKLIKEGFSEKTLVRFNDNQLVKFADKMLKEAQTVTTTKTVYAASNPQDKAAVNALLDKAAHDPSVLKDKNVEVKEDKKWIQKAIDPKKKGQLHKDLNVPQDEKIPADKLNAAAKKKGKVGQRARMALNLKNINEFVDNVVDKKYHTITTKSEIMEMVKLKMNGIVSEDLSERKMPKLPEFLSFDSIMSAGKPEEAPAQPEVIPDTPTREKPTREDNPRKRPFRNPNEEPVPESDPKAKIKKLHRNKMSMAAE